MPHSTSRCCSPSKEQRVQPALCHSGISALYCSPTLGCPSRTAEEGLPAAGRKVSPRSAVQAQRAGDAPPRLSPVPLQSPESRCQTVPRRPLPLVCLHHPALACSAEAANKEAGRAAGCRHLSAKRWRAATAQPSTGNDFRSLRVWARASRGTETKDLSPGASALLKMLLGFSPAEDQAWAGSAETPPPSRYLSPSWDVQPGQYANRPGAQFYQSIAFYFFLSGSLIELSELLQDQLCQVVERWLS